MTPKDISSIVEAIRTEIEAIVTTQVQTAVEEIPYRVRKELEGNAYQAVRAAVDEVVRDGVIIRMELKSA